LATAKLPSFGRYSYATQYNLIQPRTFCQTHDPTLMRGIQASPMFSNTLEVAEILSAPLGWDSESW